MATARQRGARAAAAARARRPAEAVSPGGRPRIEPAVLLGGAALVIVVLASGLAVDPAALASFDAPKRLLAQLGVVLAAVALLIGSRRAPRGFRALAPAQRRVLGALVVAVAAGVAAAVLSPRSATALPALRAALVLGLLLPLGASRALGGGGATLLLGAFVAVSSVNAVAVLLERATGVAPLAVETVAGRSSTVALVGNEGSLALLLALAAVASLAVALQVRTAASRIAMLAATVVLGAGLVASAGLTALLGLLAGVGCVSVALLGRRALLVSGALLVVLAVPATLYAPLRARVADAISAARTGDWDALLTYRSGPWAAAAEMIRARPLAGYGPGTFGAEFVAHRLQAELRHRRRFLVPRETSTYGEAHSDYLQAFAEGGAVAGVALLAGLVLLGTALAGRLRDDAGAERREVVVVLGVLAAGAVGALTWFPLQQASIAPVLLLALGRGWRLLGDAGSEAAAATPASTAASVAGWLGAALLLVLVVPPELRRYAAERELGRASSAVQALLATGPASVAPPVLDAIAERTAAAAGALPGDSRPLLAAGAADLLARRPERALERYRAALALGERAETDLNAGRAFALLDRRPDAFAAFVRTAWISPPLVFSMPVAAQPLVHAELTRLEAELRAGRLVAPPPLPGPLAAAVAP